MTKALKVRLIGEMVVIAFFVLADALLALLKNGLGGGLSASTALSRGAQHGLAIWLMCRLVCYPVAKLIGTRVNAMQEKEKAAYEAAKRRRREQSTKAE